jgi:hypothetical protein
MMRTTPAGSRSNDDEADSSIAQVLIHPRPECVDAVLAGDLAEVIIRFLLRWEPSFKVTPQRPRRPVPHPVCRVLEQLADHLAVDAPVTRTLYFDEDGDASCINEKVIKTHRHLVRVLHGLLSLDKQQSDTTVARSGHASNDLRELGQRILQNGFGLVRHLPHYPQVVPATQEDRLAVTHKTTNHSARRRTCPPRVCLRQRARTQLKTESCARSSKAAGRAAATAGTGAAGTAALAHLRTGWADGAREHDGRLSRQPTRLVLLSGC